MSFRADQNAYASSAAYEWQPMETAPKDGTEILVWDAVHRVRYIAACYTDSTGKHEWWEDQMDYPCIPFRWQLLPDPPKSEK